MSRLLLADDQSMMRQTLARALADRGFAIVAECEDGENAVSEAKLHHPDLVLMEAHLPHTSGVDACRRIINNVPSTRVMILTAERATSVLAGAFRAGATGYLLKSASFDDLLVAVQRVLRGETVVSRELKPALLAEARGLVDSTASANGHGPVSGAPQPKPISKRENEVLQLIADGCSTTEVAEQLFISQKTVKNHLASIYQKLDARDRTQAVLRAVRLGIVDLG